MKRLIHSFRDLLFPPRCVACETILLSSRDSLCVACDQSVTWFPDRVRSSDVAEVCESIWALAVYEGPWQGMIHRFKFENRYELASRLADVMMARWGDALNQIKWDWVVPVPIHHRRLKARGYNQSALLAQALAKRLDVAVSLDLLTKPVATSPQVGLEKTARWKNVSGAFVCSTADLANRRILLVDDVLTTGATIFHAASTLKKAGATVSAALISATR